MKKTVVITGAAGDIGHAISRIFLKHAFTVIATDINEKALNSRANLCSSHRNYHPVIMDITNPKSVSEVFARIHKKWGAIAILVNNAGGISAHNLKSTTEQSWSNDIELNLNGAWRCMNAVMDRMINSSSGSIINIASVNGLGIFGHPGYSVAKAGLIHLTKFAAVELGKHNIKCNAICPGTVKTQAWIERQNAHPQIIEDAMQWYPTGKASTPEDIAGLVEYIAMQSPDTLNGAALEIDGGLSAGHNIVASAFCGEAI